MVACSNRPCACLAGGSGIVTVELVERNESDEECEANTCAMHTAENGVRIPEPMANTHALACIKHERMKRKKKRKTDCQPTTQIDGHFME